jgi:DNA-binding MarR family transcriptional regulator
MAEPVFSRIKGSTFDHFFDESDTYLKHAWGNLQYQREILPIGGVSGHMPDEVARLVADWSRERPDLNVAPLEVLSRITRIARHLDIARRSAFADLDTWGFDVLAALRRSGEPYQLSPGQLLQETMVTSGTMTNRLDRLEELNLITRKPDPRDGRGSLVTLTKSGMRAVDAAMEDLLEQEGAFLQSLTEAERVKLASLLALVAAPFDEQQD